MSTETSPASPGRIAGVEVRSIDYVPLNERHGKVWSQGPLWFMSNAQIATLAVGTFSITGGGNLIWSILAIISGVLFGTFFMAFHSAQGPQLGLPQMIQSRPQFGYVGALLVWAFAYLQYAGFNIFNTILAGDALHSTIGGPSKMWIVVATFVRGSKWNLMPIPGILAALQLYADRPFEERWGKAAHALSRHGGKLLGWYANIDDLPEESNYVGLDFNLPDSDGLPAARVHYQLSQNSLRSMDFAGERMTEAHLTAGAVDVFTTRRMPSGHILGRPR
jgi:hypothetical protein